MTDREALLEKVNALLECDLDLIGATAIEDKL
jgi:magnesium-transporting ATPase (P-type)